MLVIEPGEPANHQEFMIGYGVHPIQLEIRSSSFSVSPNMMAMPRMPRDLLTQCSISK